MKDRIIYIGPRDAPPYACGQNGSAHVFSFRDDACDCGEVECDFSLDAIDYEVARTLHENGRHIERAESLQQLQREKTWLNAFVVRGQELAEWLSRATYEEQADEFNRALRSQGRVMDLASLTVSNWPKFLTTFYEETVERLKFEKETAKRRSGERGREVFKQIQDRFGIGPVAGRPKVDREERRRKVSEGILSDLAEVANIVRRVWSTDRLLCGEQQDQLIRLTTDFAEVGSKSAGDKIKKTWRRQSLRPKTLAAAVLCLKWRSRLDTGLPESDVAKIITPRWRQVYGAQNS